MDPFLASLNVRKLQRWAANPDRTLHYGLPLVLRDPTLVQCTPWRAIMTCPVPPLEPPSQGARAITPPPPLIDEDGRVVTSPSDAQQMDEDADYDRSLLAPEASHRAVRERDANVVVSTRARGPGAMDIRWIGVPETWHPGTMADREKVVKLTAELEAVLAQLEEAKERILILTADLESAEHIAGLSQSPSQ